MVTWIATSSFQYLEVRQSKASWPHLDKRSFLEVGNLNGVSLTSLGTPWCYSTLRYWHFSGHWQTFVLFQVWKDLFPAQLLGCSCLSLSEALTSQCTLPILKELRLGRQASSAFDLHNRKVPWYMGTQGAWLLFGINERGKYNQNKTRNIINQTVWLAADKNFLVKGLWITLEE